MRLLLLSDLHFEFHRDGGRSFVADLADPSGVDVCVLAGDIAVGGGIGPVLELFCKRYRWVVYVCGNHEYYGSSRSEVREHMGEVVRAFSNLVWLDVGTAEIEGQRFVGATLWFSGRDQWWHQMNDFHVIQGFEEWVYEDNAATLRLLEGVGADDVVVTHHLPSFRSVHPAYVGSPLNSYFVCDVGDEVLSRPRLWVHGHTHMSTEYTIGSTRVICNPFGYARVGENAKFDFNKIVLV